jgi:hypothetical protein
LWGGGGGFEKLEAKMQNILNIFPAGDYVKFGFPMASTMTVLAMGGIFFPEGYTKAGQTGYLLDAIKWGTDYFIKCHVSANEFYGQVGMKKWFCTKMSNIIEMLQLLAYT